MIFMERDRLIIEIYKKLILSQIIYSDINLIILKFLDIVPLFSINELGSDQSI